MDRCKDEISVPSAVAVKPIAASGRVANSMTALSSPSDDSIVKPVTSKMTGALTSSCASISSGLGVRSVISGDDNSAFHSSAVQQSVMSSSGRAGSGSSYIVPPHRYCHPSFYYHVTPDTSHILDSHAAVPAETLTSSKNPRATAAVSAMTLGCSNEQGCKDHSTSSSGDASSHQSNNTNTSSTGSSSHRGGNRGVRKVCNDMNMSGTRTCIREGEGCVDSVNEVAASSITRECGVYITSTNTSANSSNQAHHDSTERPDAANIVTNAYPRGDGHNTSVSSANDSGSNSSHNLSKAEESCKKSYASSSRETTHKSNTHLSTCATHGDETVMNSSVAPPFGGTDLLLSRRTWLSVSQTATTGESTRRTAIAAATTISIANKPNTSSWECHAESSERVLSGGIDSATETSALSLRSSVGDEATEVSASTPISPPPVSPGQPGRRATATKCTIGCGSDSAGQIIIEGGVPTKLLSQQAVGATNLSAPHVHRMRHSQLHLPDTQLGDARNNMPGEHGTVDANSNSDNTAAAAASHAGSNHNSHATGKSTSGTTNRCSSSSSSCNSGGCGSNSTKHSEEHLRSEERKTSRSAKSSRVISSVTPELTPALCALVDSEVISGLIPTNEELSCRRAHLRTLAEYLVQAIRHTGAAQGKSYGHIRFYVFGSVNMRTVLPEGDNDITIELEGLLPSEAGNPIPCPFAHTPLVFLAATSSSASSSSSSSTASASFSVSSPAPQPRSPARAKKKLPSTANGADASQVSHAPVDNNATQATTTATTASTPLLPVSTDSNGANKEGSLQVALRADGQPVTAPPVAFCIAAGEVLMRVRDYLRQVEDCPIFVEALVMAEVRVLKMIMHGRSYDITIGQFGGLNCVRFLHEMDAEVGGQHLLKRTLLLLKAWCAYEAHVLGGQAGYLSSYAATIMLISMINTVEFVEDVVMDANSTDTATAEEGVSKTNKKQCGGSAVSSAHLFRGDITPLALFARFLKFFCYFDYDHYCVTAFGPLPLTSITSTPYDLSQLEVPAARRHRPHRSDHHRDANNSTHAQRYSEDPLGHSTHIGETSTAAATTGQSLSSHSSPASRCACMHGRVKEDRSNTTSAVAVNYDFLGLTEEGKRAMGHLIRRRRAPLLTVSGVKHLLHEMNMSRVQERQQWYADRCQRSATATTAAPGCSNFCHSDVSPSPQHGTTMHNRSNANEDETSVLRSHVTESSSHKTDSLQAMMSTRDITLEGVASQPSSLSSFAASTSSASTRVQLNRPGCVDEDAELICPSCNTALFPVRCMNVLDPLRWSSNMVRGVCRHHLQRITRAFREGLRMMQHASQALAEADVPAPAPTSTKGACEKSNSHVNNHISATTAATHDDAADSSGSDPTSVASERGTYSSSSTSHRTHICQRELSLQEQQRQLVSTAAVSNIIPRDVRGNEAAHNACHSVQCHEEEETGEHAPDTNVSVEASEKVTQAALIAGDNSGLLAQATISPLHQPIHLSPLLLPPYGSSSFSASTSAAAAVAAKRNNATYTKRRVLQYLFGHTMTKITKCQSSCKGDDTEEERCHRRGTTTMASGVLRNNSNINHNNNSMNNADYANYSHLKKKHASSGNTEVALRCCSACSVASVFCAPDIPGTCACQLDFKPSTVSPHTPLHARSGMKEMAASYHIVNGQAGAGSSNSNYMSGYGHPRSGNANSSNSGGGGLPYSGYASYAKSGAGMRSGAVAAAAAAATTSCSPVSESPRRSGGGGGATSDGVASELLAAAPTFGPDGGLLYPGMTMPNHGGPNNNNSNNCNNHINTNSRISSNAIGSNSSNNNNNNSFALSTSKTGAPCVGGLVGAQHGTAMSESGARAHIQNGLHIGAAYEFSHMIASNNKVNTSSSSNNHDHGSGNNNANNNNKMNNTNKGHGVFASATSIAVPSGNTHHNSNNSNSNGCSSNAFAGVSATDVPVQTSTSVMPNILNTFPASERMSGPGSQNMLSCGANERSILATGAGYMSQSQVSMPYPIQSQTPGFDLSYNGNANSSSGVCSGNYYYGSDAGCMGNGLARSAGMYGMNVVYNSNNNGNNNNNYNAAMSHVTSSGLDHRNTVGAGIAPTMGGGGYGMPTPQMAAPHMPPGCGGAARASNTNTMSMNSGSGNDSGGGNDPYASHYSIPFGSAGCVLPQTSNRNNNNNMSNAQSGNIGAAAAGRAGGVIAQNGRYMQGGNTMSGGALGVMQGNDNAHFGNPTYSSGYASGPFWSGATITGKEDSTSAFGVGGHMTTSYIQHNRRQQQHQQRQIANNCSNNSIIMGAQTYALHPHVGTAGAHPESTAFRESVFGSACDIMYNHPPTNNVPNYMSTTTAAAPAATSMNMCYAQEQHSPFRDPSSAAMPQLQLSTMPPMTSTSTREYDNSQNVRHPNSDNTNIRGNNNFLPCPRRCT